MRTTAEAPSEICDELPAVIDPPSANAGRRPAEGLDRRIGPDPLVLRQDERGALALRDLDGNDLGVEDARLGCRGGALMGSGGHGILHLTGDLERTVVALGRCAHALAVVGVGQAVVRHVVEHLDRAVCPSVPRAHQHVRCARHGFHARRHDHLGVADSDHAGPVDDRGEPRETDLVDGCRGHRPRDAGTHSGLACGVLTGTGREDLPDEDSVDGFGGHATLLEGTPDRDAAELDRRQRCQLSLESPLRSARGCDDDDILVVHASTFSWTERTWSATMSSRLGRGDDLVDRDPGSDLEEHESLVGHVDDGEVGDDPVDDAPAGERQGALVHDLGGAVLGDVLHDAR